MDVSAIETPQLGDRSYLVIDPPRDNDRIEKAAAGADVKITHVAEIHLHDDYVTGGLVLARSQNAVYLVNATDSVSFERQPIAAGETVLVGVDDTVAITHDQYTTVRPLLEEAEHEAALYPTDGFGSVCSSDPDEEHFVKELIANDTAYPSFCAHMNPTNARGLGAADLTIPDSPDPGELSRRLNDEERVVDLRNRVAFANTHLEGTVSFEYGDGSNFTTCLGWILARNKTLTLVNTRDDVEYAIRDLSRSGIDPPGRATSHCANCQPECGQFLPVGSGYIADPATGPGSQQLCCSAPARTPSMSTPCSTTGQRPAST